MLPAHRADEVVIAVSRRIPFDLIQTTEVIMMTSCYAFSNVTLNWRSGFFRRVAFSAEIDNA